LEDTQQNQTLSASARAAPFLRRDIPQGGISCGSIEVGTMYSMSSAGSSNSLSSYLQSLLQAGTAPSATSGASGMSFGFDAFAESAAPASGGASGSSPLFSAGTMSALLAMQAQQAGETDTSGLSPWQQNVFGRLDADSDGSVTQSELENAFGSDNKALADFVMNRLDKDGDASISQSEFAAGTMRGHHHGHHGGMSPDKAGLNALMSATDGGNAQTATNSDGTTTITITYADGSKVSMTSAPSSDNSSGGNALGGSQGNLLEQLFRLQAQLMKSKAASATTTQVSV
jgi:hypothetical protein